MTADPGRRGVSTRLVAAIAALPFVLLGICLVHPGLRRNLLGPAAIGATPAVRDGGAPGGVPKPAPPSAARPSPFLHASAATPQPGSGADGSMNPSPPGPPQPAQPPVHGVVRTADGTTTVPSAALAPFLEESYRPLLPASVGPLTARIDGEHVTLESRIDLGTLRRELSEQIPGPIEAILRGDTGVQVRGRIVGSEGGIAQFAIDDVRVGGIALPTRVLGPFIQAELEGRGYVVRDPMVRPLFLPPGFESAAVDDGRLTLAPRHGGSP